jgi:3-hydroxyisobutyrate dehydrogenase
VAQTEQDVVGVIGLGAIGGHVARSLAGAGRRVVGFDVNEQAYEQFPEAEPAESPRAVAEAADVVLLAVYDDGQVRDALTRPDGVLAATSKPAAVCVLSTITLDTLRWSAERASAAGVDLIDCGVTGGAGLRSRGKIVVLAGGDDDVVAKARPTLEVFAEPLMHMGPLGAGMQAKLCRNLMHYSGWYAAWEAARIADACGIDIGKLVEAHTISSQWGGGQTALLTTGIGPEPADEADEAGMARRRSSARFAKKDLSYVLELAEELDISLPGAELVRDRIELAVGLERESPR